MKDKSNILKFRNSLVLIIICLIFPRFSIRVSHIILTSCLSKITIKINVSGNQKIFSSDYISTRPNKVLLNGNSITLQNSNEYTFSSSLNTIELIWDNDLTSCSKLFSGCSKII